MTSPKGASHRLAQNETPPGDQRFQSDINQSIWIDRPTISFLLTAH
jgi:hypothetical protein